MNELARPLIAAGLIAAACFGVSAQARPQGSTEATLTASKAAPTPPAATDGRAPVDPPLMAVLAQIRADNGGKSIFDLAEVQRLRSHILADGRVDGHERELIAELSHPLLRVVVVYPFDREDPFAGERLAFASLSSRHRPELEPLLDFPSIEQNWKSEPRREAIGKLILQSRSSPAMREAVQMFLSERFRELIPTAKVPNGYAPVRTVITDMLGAVQTMEKDGTLDQESSADARLMFHDAIDRASKASTPPLPRFLYNWLRPYL